MIERGEYDASPWTEEEMDLLAAASADELGWEGFEPYQDHGTAVIVEPPLSE